MSRDPFDEMRDRNPVSADDLPSAPMALADRIVGRRARRVRRPLPGWALAATAALVVAVAGGGLLMLTRPPADRGGADGGVTTTTATDTTVDTAVTTTTAAPLPTFETAEAAAYFLLDAEGAGPFLIPVAVSVEHREAPAGDAGARAAGIAHGVLTRLFDGPQEHAGVLPGLSSAIPDDAAFLGLEYDEAEGVATVFLSAGFASGGDSHSTLARIAQVVHTLTAIRGIDAVSFEIDGEPTTVFEGVTVPDPVTRTFPAFEAVLPGIMIDRPAHGATVHAPMVVRGTANVYEGTVLVSLVSDGQTLFEGFTTSTCGDCRGEWALQIPYDVDHPQWATLSVFAESPDDGSRLYTRTHAVLLSTAPPPTECSGELATTPFVDQEGLPEAVAETRRAIWEAATACDWAALERLIPDEFSFSFAYQDARIAVPYWQDLEAAGGTPMLYLAELLTRPHRYLAYENGVDSLYVWPSASGVEWSQVTAWEREALRPLYGDDSFAFWEEFCCYIGYRIGIADDGTWRYFIAGD